MGTLPDAIGSAINRMLSPTGLIVGRAAPSQAESWRQYIGGPYRSDRDVIKMANERGQSVGDFVEGEWGHAGRARGTVDRMREMGAIPHPLETVCEIGPGSGRYIQRLLEIASPKRYEIYEIERRRARWLARTYPVVALPTDGERLAGTSDESVQLVHAHGVFAAVKVISCFAYFKECARITSPNGHVVFDIMCEECVNDDEVDAWLTTPLRYVNFLSKPHLVRFFENQGFSLVGDFRVPLMVFGQSLYLVFQKKSG